MKHVSISFPGGVAGVDLSRRVGITRLEGIRRAVAASYALLLRKYPDLKRDSILVDVYDMPGAAAVTWVFHTGDRVVSVLNQPWTTTYRAQEFTNPTNNIIK